MDLENFNPKKTTELIGLNDKFNFLNMLFKQKKLPNTILLSGLKGIGKFTMVNHLIHSQLYPENYDLKKNIIKNKNNYYYQFIENSYPNVLYLSNLTKNNVKIDDIRQLKEQLNKSAVYNKERFIIFDEIETFNLNCSNALLKIIEEPRDKDYFFLIDNKLKPLIETIKSRCLTLKIFLKDNEKEEIISSLAKRLNQEIILDKNIIDTSPGNFMKYNYIFKEKKINIEDNFVYNLNIILNIYKKEKNPFYQELLIFFTNYFFQKKLINSNLQRNFFEKKNEILKRINDFFLHNLNQNTLISSIESRLLHE